MFGCATLTRKNLPPKHNSGLQLLFHMDYTGFELPFILIILFIKQLYFVCVVFVLKFVL